MITAHTGRADAAKGNIFLHHLPRGLVNCGPSGDSIFEDIIAPGFVLAEPIERQRPFSALDILQGIFEGLTGHYRQQGAEYFFLVKSKIDSPINKFWMISKSTSVPKKLLNSVKSPSK